MANQQQANILSGIRSSASTIADSVNNLVDFRTRFNAFNGTTGFEGTGLLFNADGSGQEIPYNDLLGVLNSLGALEGTTQWPAFLAALARARA